MNFYVFELYSLFHKRNESAFRQPWLPFHLYPLVHHSFQELPLKGWPQENSLHLSLFRYSFFASSNPSLYQNLFHSCTVIHQYTEGYFIAFRISVFCVWKYCLAAFDHRPGLVIFFVALFIPLKHTFS